MDNSRIITEKRGSSAKEDEQDDGSPGPARKRWNIVDAKIQMTLKKEMIPLA